MIITWLGQACFEIQSGNTTIIIDPYDEKIGFKLPVCNPDILLITHAHYDHSNVKAFPATATVIDKPGEYTSGNISVRGIQAFHDNVQGAQRGLNTIYRIELEGVSLVHMGDFGEENIRPETLEAIGNVDILMIPVGGTYTIDGAQAAVIAKKIAAPITIPMHYFIPGLNIQLADASSFLEHMGVPGSTPHDELKITQEDFKKDSQEVIVLSRASS
ncbi:MAG: MBL fold metallo-hydrolase [Patescibacteria group bacterium]